MRLLPRLAVDLLPSRLWTPPNLFTLPGGDWHFCVKPGPNDQAFRTIEWRGRELALSCRPVDLAAH